MNRLRHIFFIAFLSFIASPANCDSVLFTGNAVHQLEGWRISQNNLITAQAIGGSTMTVALDQVSALVSLPGPPRVPAMPLVTLTNGEVIRGRIEPAAQGNGMTLQNGWPADLPIKTEEIHDIRITGVPYPQTPGVAPCVIPANGDLVSGEIRSVTRDGVRIGSVFGDVSLPMVSIGAIIMQDGPPVEDGRQGAEWLISFTDGTKIHADAIQASPTPGLLVFRWRGKETPPRPSAEVSQILSPGITYESLGDKGTYQADVKAILEQKTEPQTGHNAAGGPLWIANRFFTNGIGTMPATTLTLNLPDSSLFVCGWVGLDTHQGKQGNAAVSVRVDNKTLLDEKAFSYSRGALGFAGTCSGSKTLVLSTGEGEQGSFGDYINWCGLMALKTRKAAP